MAERVAPQRLYVCCDGGAETEPDRLVVVEAGPESGAAVYRLPLSYPADGVHRAARIGPRRLLLLGARSSRLYVIATDDPARPEIVRVVEPELLARRCGLSGPHGAVVLPDGNVVVSLVADRRGGPRGGFAVLERGDFDLLGRWDEKDAGLCPGALLAAPGDRDLVAGSWAAPGVDGVPAVCAWDTGDRRPAGVWPLEGARGPVALVDGLAAASGGVWAWTRQEGGGLALTSAHPDLAGSADPPELAAGPGRLGWLAADGGLYGPLLRLEGSEEGPVQRSPGRLRLPGGGPCRLAASSDGRWLYATAAGHPAWDRAGQGQWLWAVEIGVPAQDGESERDPRLRWRCAPGTGPDQVARDVLVLDG